MTLNPRDAWKPLEGGHGSLAGARKEHRNSDTLEPKLREQQNRIVDDGGASVSFAKDSSLDGTSGAQLHTATAQREDNQPFRRLFDKPPYLSVPGLRAKQLFPGNYGAGHTGTIVKKADMLLRTSHKARLCRSPWNWQRLHQVQLHSSKAREAVAERDWLRRHSRNIKTQPCCREVLRDPRGCCIVCCRCGNAHVFQRGCLQVACPLACDFQQICRVQTFRTQCSSVSTRHRGLGLRVFGVGLKQPSTEVQHRVLNFNTGLDPRFKIQDVSETFLWSLES